MAGWRLHGTRPPAVVARWAPTTSTSRMTEENTPPPTLAPDGDGVAWHRRRRPRILGAIMLVVAVAVESVEVSSQSHPMLPDDARAPAQPMPPSLVEPKQSFQLCRSTQPPSSARHRRYLVSFSYASICIFDTYHARACGHISRRTSLLDQLAWPILLACPGAWIGSPATR